MIGISYTTPKPKTTRLKWCIRESDTVTWVTGDRIHVLVKDMTASHLINTVLMLRASVESLRENEIATLIYEAPTNFENTITVIRGMAVEEYLLSRIPPYQCMLERLQRNGFDIRNLKRIDRDELESPQWAARRMARAHLRKRKERMERARRQLLVSFADDFDLADMWDNS